MANAWVYCAVSSAPQEATLDDQRRWAESVAADKGWRITRTFSGVASGNHGTRKILEEMLAELRVTTGRPKYILLTRIDRLGRGMGLETIAAMAEIRKLGVTLYTRDLGEIKIERVMDAVLPMLASITSAMENEVRREKSLAMHAGKRARGEHQGLAPYGTVIAGNKMLAIQEPQAQIVRELFALRLRGWGYNRIARWAGVHAPGKRWAPSTIRTMLGLRSYRDLVVDARTWDTVYAMRANAAPIPREAKNPWPLGGTLKCLCGQRLSGRLSGPAHHRTRYYVCPNAPEHGRYVGHRADTLERHFAWTLTRLSTDATVIAATPPDLDALRAKRTDLLRERTRNDERRQTAWTLAETHGIPGAELARRIESLAQERTQIMQAIAALDAELAAASGLRAASVSARQVLAEMAAAWNDLAVPDQREIARAVAALPGVDGFWTDPARKNVLLTGADLRAANDQKADAFRALTAWAILAHLRTPGVPAH